MALNPLVFLLGGLALLVSTLTIAFLNRRSVVTDNPYDTPHESKDLGQALRAIRHGDALYRAGLELGQEYPSPTPERVAESIKRLGLGDVEIQRMARRVELTIRDGPLVGAPQVDEPLCYFTLGLLRGAFKDRQGITRVVEEACHGTGAPHCVFSMEVSRQRVPQQA